MSWMLRLVLVPVIMLLATGGTVGLIALIRHFFPGLFDRADWMNRR